MALLSLAAFGFDFWLAFVEASREAVSARVVDEMFQRFFMHMTTLLAAARIAGLPPGLAAVISSAARRFRLPPYGWPSGGPETARRASPCW